MKQSMIFRKIELFLVSNIYRKFSFKTFMLRDNYAHLAKLNHQLLANYSTTRVESAHFYDNDCFECLLPHTIIT